MTADNLSIAELAALAAQNEDQTETTAGGDFEYELPAEGNTVARFIEYVELGVHGQKAYKGKDKPDVEYVRFAFELCSPKHIKEIELEGGVKKTVANIISVTLAKKFGEKAAFKKLFNKMVYGRDNIKHFAQMLGEGFLIKVVHNSTGEGKDKKTYANMNDSEGVWQIGVARFQNPLTEEVTVLPVPDAINPIRIFLWDNPNKPTWDSIFIDGTRTVKVDGKDVEQSKNWMQNRIRAAKNFENSPVHKLIGGTAQVEKELAEAHDKAIVEADKTKDTASTEADAMKLLGL